VIEVKKTWFNLLLVCLGLSLSMTAQAQLRVKPYTQSGTIGVEEFDGTGIDLTAIANPESGLFLGVSLNYGDNGYEWYQPQGESKFDMTEVTVGKAMPSGITYFGGLTNTGMESYSSGKSYNATISGLFFGVAAAKPFAGGVVSASGSLMFGDMYANFSSNYCNTYSSYSPWYSYSNTFCGKNEQWLESDVQGLAFSLAYAYPITDSITVGLEHKSRSFNYIGFSGKDEQIDFALNRIFVDIAFR